jgi:AraC-like DNA-binding protein
MRPGPMRLHAEADYAFVAVRFRSGGLRHLCPALPACGIAEPMPTCALWGRDGIRITDALMQARSATATSAILDTWLLECLQRYGTEDRMIDHAVSRLYYRHADCRIEQLSAAYGLGRRQFERRFKLALGCSPKQFQRLARFQNTMRDLLLHGSHSYMDTALLHGYYDQAHFIHDFRHFTADQPRHFLLAQAPATHFYNPSRHNHP